jgi:predicted MFS family arabinose efflux permease
MATTPDKHFWSLALAAAAILMLTQGVRQSLGLFVAPIDASTGLGIASISFAMAMAQLMWGVVQPIAGAAADRYGATRVLAAGILVLALGNALAPLLPGTWGLVVSLGLLSAVGAGAGSFSVLLGATAHQLPASRQGLASGFINAGGSFGQFVFAPLVQRLIAGLGWMGAMWSLAAVSLAALPLVRLLRAPTGAHADLHRPASPGGLKRAVQEALADRSYLLLHAGFFTCGFHIAFLVTHLPGEVNLCGLPASVASWSLAIIGLTNIVGSLLAGHWVSRHRSKVVLFWMYGSRTLLVLAYLALPSSDWTFYAFAAGLGLTWLATVPPTARLVGKLFGTRYLATLFGLTLLSHQIGGFFGAWLGGIALAQGGNYLWMWYADAVLAAIAALCNLPIREERLPQPAGAAASSI